MPIVRHLQDHFSPAYRWIRDIRHPQISPITSITTQMFPIVQLPRQNYN